MVHQYYWQCPCRKSEKMRRNTPNYVYYESHHILPISVCPQYSCFKQYPWNKVLLTAKEHLLCHMLLPKFVTDGPVKFKLIHALYAMTQQSNSQQQRPNMRIYSYAKEQMIKIRSDINASQEWREKLSADSRGEKNNMFGKTGEKNLFFGKKHSEETRKIISAKAKLRKVSIETLEKLRGPRGPQKNPAPILTCPHCGLQSEKGNNWHFDKCRHKSRFNPDEWP